MTYFYFLLVIHTYIYIDDIAKIISTFLFGEIIKYKNTKKNTKLTETQKEKLVNIGISKSIGGHRDHHKIDGENDNLTNINQNNDFNKQGDIMIMYEGGRTSYALKYFD